MDLNKVFSGWFHYYSVKYVSLKVIFATMNKRVAYVINTHQVVSSKEYGLLFMYFLLMQVLLESMFGFYCIVFFTITNMWTTQKETLLENKLRNIKINILFITLG